MKLARVLNDAQVRGLAKRPGLWAVGVVSGLCLQVSPKGAASWVLRGTYGSRVRTMCFGPFSRSFAEGGTGVCRESSRSDTRRSWSDWGTRSREAGIGRGYGTSCHVRASGDENTSKPWSGVSCAASTAGRHGSDVWTSTAQRSRTNRSRRSCAYLELVVAQRWVLVPGRIVLVLRHFSSACVFKHPEVVNREMNTAHHPNDFVAHEAQRLSSGSSLPTTVFLRFDRKSRLLELGLAVALDPTRDTEYSYRW